MKKLTKFIPNLRKTFAVIFATSLIFASFACKTETNDTTAPAEVFNLAVTSANGNAVLTWTNPTDADFAGVKISVSPAAGTLENAVTLDKGVISFTASGLTIGSEYTFTVQTFDTSLNYSLGTSKIVVVSDTSDKTAPAEVFNLAVTSANGNAVLTWTNPTDADFAGVKISVSPAAGTLENAVTLDKGVISFTASGLTIGSEYTFTVQTFDTSLNYSLGTSKIVVVSDTSDKTAPAEVFNLAVTSANGNAVLTWTNPTDADFAGVKISASPAAGTLENAVTLDKGVTSFTASGLTIGSEYTFTVQTFDTSLNYSLGTSKTATVSDTSDKTAPAEVRDLTVTAKNSSVLLTWIDPTDEDLFGIEITYTSNSSTRSAISAMQEGSVFVAPKTQTATITNLTNGTSYTFTLKTMDTSGNKSSGVKSDSVSPKAVEVDASEPLSIALTTSVPQENGYTGNKSNTSVTVTANITTANTVKKVVYKKDGTKVAQDLLADTDATELTVDENDNKKWSFTLTATDETANGTYTVAAIDEAGREETAQIEIDNFDFTAPAKVKVTSGIYSSELSCIILNWTEPSDSDFDHVKITYTSNDGTSNSKESDAITVSKGTVNKTFTSIDNSKAYYTYCFVSVDSVGNETSALKYKVSVNSSVSNVPEGFVEVKGGTITGKSNTNNYNGVFIEGRTVTLSDFYIAQYETTQDEYKEVMKGQTVTVNGTEYTLESDPSFCKEGSSEYALANPGEQGKRPVEGVTWYDAVYYCNARSEKEGLTKAYNITVTTVDSDNHITGATVSLVDGADGYRLPTEAEWEYAARGGDPTATEWDYTFSGADTASGTSYSSSTNSGLDSVGWYCYNNITGTTGTSDVTNAASGKGTHQVGQKNANTLGIYDMSGNVWEWCYDWYNSISTGEASDPTGAASGSNRVGRGGSWYDYANYAAVCLRYYNNPYSRYYNLGFRVVRSSSN